MLRVLLVAALASSLLVAAAAPAGQAGAPSRAAIVRCFEERRVLVDAGASVYLPARVVARERQLALSFVFVPDAYVPGLTAVVVTSPTPAAAARTRARVAAFLGRSPTVPPAVGRRAVERRGSAVVAWLSGPHAYARRVATACLGPRSA